MLHTPRTLQKTLRLALQNEQVVELTSQRGPAPTARDT